MYNSPKLLATAVLAATLAACGAQDSGESAATDAAGADTQVTEDSRSLAFSVNVDQALTAGVSATNATITLTKGELQRSQTIPLDGDNLNVSFNSLPIGDYQIAVQVFDGSDVVAAGTGAATIAADTQSEVSLVLNPVTGNLQLNLCMPDSGVEYVHGNHSSTLILNEPPELIDSNNVEFYQLRNSLVGKTALSVDYSFGDGIDMFAGVESGEAFNKVVDHGASVTVTADGQVIAAASGCNNEMLYEISADSFRVMYKISGGYDQGIDISLGGVPLGQILADGLGVIIEYRDTNNDAIPANATQVSELNFANFDSQKVYVGIPRLTGTSGSVSLLIDSVDDLITQRGFAAESAEVSLPVQ